MKQWNLQKLLLLMLLYNISALFGESVANKGEAEAQKNKNKIRYYVHDELMPKGLIGISDDQIQDHWKLYKGYVDQVNILNQELAQMRTDDEGATLFYADRRRRYGFEYNGMVLHELYFANLKAHQKYVKTSLLHKALIDKFGSYDGWYKDFIQAGKTRGIGWAILVVDSATGMLLNLFIADHEINHIAGFIPIVVMDVWEHAYMVDHDAQGRAAYIEAFMQNINWPLVEKRFTAASHGKIIKRF